MARRVFLVEDHPVMREGYVSLIGAEPDLRVVGEASSAEEAFALSAGLDYDLAVVDLSLPGTNGIELIKRLRSLDPDVRVLVVSAHEESVYAERALRAGARGYLMKHEPPHQFVAAVWAVLDGELYLSEPFQDRFGHASEPESPLDRLTDREIEVFEQFGRGQSTREVAETLGLSPKTIESHRINISHKLGLEHSTQFAQRAVRWVASSMQSDPTGE